MRLIFMGTPQFAAGALEAILEAGHEVVCVVTQPDKPKGRGKVMQCCKGVRRKARDTGISAS